MESFADRELKNLIVKNWMTHDAMWFFHCLKECGIEKTNKINRAAVRSMAMIEVKRIKKKFEVERIETFDQFKDFMEKAYGIVKADFMKFDYRFPSEDVCRFEMQECFAHDGIKRIGVIDEYQCGIFERIEGWFDGLGIHYDVTPKVDVCMMHTDGKCFRDFKLKLS
jgi:Family of unknown function (DUF6125)